MIDFTNAVEELNNYSGSEKKKTLIYNNKKYLVKFPDPIREKDKNISYINNAFSEYVGSNFFKLSGFDTQATILGTYFYNGKNKIVCACEDFTDSNHILYEFEKLVLSTNPDKKIDTELDDILEVINENKIINSTDTIQKFWNMFIIDGLIGNTDRHNGNWGFLINSKTREIKFAPIYDCGSCLNPMLEDEYLDKINSTELKNLALNCYSCIKENGKKINYMSFICSMKNDYCNNAIITVFPMINLNKIFDFIDEIECMSSIRKNFYKNILNYRYKIINQVYLNLINQ